MTLRYQSAGLSYDITIGTGILGDAGKLFALDRKVLVITDEGVPPEYAASILRQCPDASLLVIPQGEGAKSFGTLHTILSALQERGFTRRDAIVAVGGGVVGDVSGFAAACYQRGIDYYNVPTTLLSQVDSSVGGKTAINFNGIKNLVGAFHHPSGVLIDAAVLDTLPGRLLSEGLAEVIKMAATCSEPLFRRLEEVTDLKPALPEIISRALQIKLDIVTRDPSEKGLRAVLNFGHTLGHAIESASQERVSFETTIPLHPQGTGEGSPETPSVGTSCLRSTLSDGSKNYDATGSSAGCGGTADATGSIAGCGGAADAPGCVAARGGEQLPDRSHPRLRKREGPAEREGSRSDVRELYSDTGGAYYHGEAVAVGMLYTSQGEAKQRIQQLLLKYGLPVTDPFTPTQLHHYTLSDKKRTATTTRIVTVSTIGTYTFRSLTDTELLQLIKARKNEE
ncbi:MAG: 3-dehydroquinate synthase [Bacteroidales bacterium]|nr:3-dehydroquinate synthase [Bacteroidales bacterium]